MSTTENQTWDRVGGDPRPCVGEHFQRLDLVLTEYRENYHALVG